MQPIFITADADEAAEIKKLSRSDRQQLAKHIRKEAIAMRRAVKFIALLPIAHLGGKLRSTVQPKVWAIFRVPGTTDRVTDKRVSMRVARLFSVGIAVAAE
jgi:hypothetical protein